MMKNLKERLSEGLQKTKDTSVRGYRFSKRVLKNSSFFSSSSSQRSVKTKQRVIASIFACFVVLMFVFLLKGSFAKRRKKNLEQKSTTAITKTTKKFTGMNASLSEEEAFRHTVVENAKETSKQLGNLRKKINEAMQNGKGSNSGEVVLLKNRITTLEDNFRRLQAKAQRGMSENMPIEKITLNLSSKKKKKIATVDNTIPAGAFAKAVLMSGVDASTAVTAPSNPLSVLIRVTDHGTLPRKFKSDLKDCHVLVSAYGELSSQRVYMRLDKLSCTERSTGELVETAVAGFVTGEDGVNGIRGRVRDESHKYLKNAAIGGIINGFSNALNPREGSIPYISLGTPKAPTVRENFQRGFAGGMSGSMEKLSQHYLDMAGILSPVIGVSPGRIIDIIFTEKAEIGSTRVKQEIAKKRDAKRREIARNLAENDNFK